MILGNRPFKLFIGVQIAIVFLAAVTGLLTFSKAQAANLTNTYENKIIDHVFRGVPFSASTPGNFYLALYTSGCSDATPGAEVSGGGYARVAIARNLTAWLSTQGDTTQSNGTSGTISNAQLLQFPTPTSDWGTITSIGITDHITAGSQIICQNLFINKTISLGDPGPRFQVGKISIKIDN